MASPLHHNGRTATPVRFGRVLCFVERVDLVVERGELLVICGAVGAGKSTTLTLRLAARFSATVTVSSSVPFRSAILLELQHMGVRSAPPPKRRVVHSASVRVGERGKRPVPFSRRW